MENRNVKISSYEKEQHELKIALNMVGINVDYITTDLIYKTINEYNKLKGKMTVTDAVRVKYEHDIYWETYFKIQENKEEHSSERDLDKKEWVKSKEARQILKISTVTLTTLRKNGMIPYSKIGGTFLYKKEDIEKVLQKNKHEESDENY